MSSYDPQYHYRNEVTEAQQLAHECSEPVLHGNGLAPFVKVHRLAELFGRLNHGAWKIELGDYKREKESRAYDLAKERRFSKRQRREVLAGRYPEPEPDWEPVEE